MADQPGYTRVPNAILDDLYMFSEVKLKLVLTVVRKTIGWQKDCDAISLSQFESITGKSRPAINEALKELVTDRWLTITGKGKRGTPCWSCGPRLVNSVNQLNELTSELSLLDPVNSVNQTSPGLVNSVNTQKKESKERIKKHGDVRARTPPAPKQTSMSHFSEPVQIYKELTGIKTLPPVWADKIAETVIDLAHWRIVIESWCGRYDKRNTDGMLDWYLHPEKMERRNGHKNGYNGRQPANAVIPDRPVSRGQADFERDYLAKLAREAGEPLSDL